MCIQKRNSYEEDLKMVNEELKSCKAAIRDPLQAIIAQLPNVIDATKDCFKPVSKSMEKQNGMFSSSSSSYELSSNEKFLEANYFRILMSDEDNGE